MSHQLLLRLYAEGSTDEAFLQPLIQRLAEDILAGGSVEVLPLNPPVRLKDNEKSPDRAVNIIQAARKADGSHILIVHNDVDKRSYAETYNQLIKPGLEKIKQLKIENPASRFCDKIVPLLPQHMIEAWVIADQKKLREILKTNKSARELGLPSLKEIERIADPKSILNGAIDIARKDHPARRRNKDTSTMRSQIYTNMGLEVDLAILKKLPSFQKFKDALAQALGELGLVH